MRRFCFFILIPFSLVATSPVPATAQATKGQYYFLSALFAAGAAGGFYLFKNIEECDEVTFRPQNERERDCLRRWTLKWGGLAVGVVGTIGVIQMLDAARKADNRRQPVALINVPTATGEKPKIRLPDITYQFPNRGTSVRLLAVTF